MVRYIVHGEFGIVMKRFALYETEEYKEWLKTQTLKSQRQILDRLLNIEEESHFGHHKYLEEDV